MSIVNFVSSLSISLLGVLTLLTFGSNAQQTWPNNQQVAISLSYDDALNSQLDNALPALNQRGLKASFYVVPLADAFKIRLNEWRDLAAQGHELGNHSLFHACLQHKPGREWVDPGNALDNKTVKSMVNEITVASTLLSALDGQTVHTLTPPCFDQEVADGNYVNAVKNLFIGVKGTEDPNFAALIAPSNLSSDEIIAFIEQQPANIRLVNVLFHGIGGDHLVTSTAEHTKFLDYLVAHKERYWVATYRDIMLAQQAVKN